MPARQAIDGRSNSQTAVDLCNEVDDVFACRRWAVRPTDRTIARLYTAAALRHTLHLTSKLQEAADRDDETVARILARAQMEAFLVALFLHLDGPAAVDAITGDSRRELEAWVNDIEQYNRALRSEQRKASRSNKRIRKANADRARHNELHPDQQPLELIPEVPVPLGEAIEIDLRPALVNHPGESTKLSLRDMASRVTQLLRQESDSGTMEVLYNYGYRLLSRQGAHAGLSMIDSYFTNRDRMFVTVAARSTTKPGAAGSAYVAIVLSSYLCLKVLASEADAEMLVTARAVQVAAEKAVHDATQE